MDRLNAMRSFVEVANCSSFTQAADHLGMSRLQVSRHVQEIETISHLKDHHCFRHLDVSKWQFVKDNQQHSVDVSGTMKANDVGVFVQATCRGKGIAKLPCDIANPIIERGQLVPILSKYVVPTSTLWAVYLSRSYQLPVVCQFIDFVADTWSQDIVRPS